MFYGRRFFTDTPAYPLEADERRELTALRTEAEALKASMADIERHISGLENKD